jgi:hypothetical protein
MAPKPAPTAGKAPTTTGTVTATASKAVHPDTGISNKAMAILNSVVNGIVECIATEAPSESRSLLVYATFLRHSSMV